LFQIIAAFEIFFASLASVQREKQELFVNFLLFTNDWFHGDTAWGKLSQKYHRE